MKSNRIGLVSMFASLAASFPVSLAFRAPFVKGTPDASLPLKISVNSKAPDFALESSDGKTVRLSDYAGHAVLIDFYRGYW